MIKLSDNALLRLRELKQKHNKKYVRPDGSASMGFNYECPFADEEQRNDAIIDDILLLVSRDYELYLMGLELDYEYDDFESTFKFNNPAFHIFIKNALVFQFNDSKCTKYPSPFI